MQAAATPDTASGPEQKQSRLCVASAEPNMPRDATKLPTESSARGFSPRVTWPERSRVRACRQSIWSACCSVCVSRGIQKHHLWHPASAPASQPFEPSNGENVGVSTSSLTKFVQSAHGDRSGCSVHVCYVAAYVHTLLRSWAAWPASPLGYNKLAFANSCHVPRDPGFKSHAKLWIEATFPTPGVCLFAETIVSIDAAAMRACRICSLFVINVAEIAGP